METNDYTETPETLASKFGITATVEQIDERPDHVAGLDRWGATHYRVVLTNDPAEEGVEVYYSQGSAITEPPTAGEVLAAVVRDFQYMEDAEEPMLPAAVRSIDRTTAALRDMLTEVEWEVLLDDVSEVEW